MKEPYITTEDQYLRACALLTEWEKEIKEMTYEERQRRREGNLPPFDRYWRGCEAVAIYEWDRP